MCRTILALSTAMLICASSQFAFANEGGTITGGVGGAVAGAVVGGPVGAVVGGVGGVKAWICWKHGVGMTLPAA